MKAYATQMICETDPRKLIHKYIYCSNQGFFEAGFGSGIIPRQSLKISAKNKNKKQTNKHTNDRQPDSRQHSRKQHKQG
jgi:hypothetical protein